MNKEHLEIIGYFVEFVQGGGPATGNWNIFSRWMEEMGYAEDEVESAVKALGEEIGRDL